MVITCDSAGLGRLPGNVWTGIVGYNSVKLMPPDGAVGEVAVASPDVERVKPPIAKFRGVGGDVSEGLVKPPRANTAAVKSVTSHVELSVTTMVCPVVWPAILVHVPINPETVVTVVVAGTVIPEGNVTVIVPNDPEMSPELDAVKPISQEAGIPTAVVVGSNDTLDDEVRFGCLTGEPLVGRLGAESLTPFGVEDSWEDLPILTPTRLVAPAEAENRVIEGNTIATPTRIVTAFTAGRRSTLMRPLIRDNSLRPSIPLTKRLLADTVDRSRILKTQLHTS